MASPDAFLSSPARNAARFVNVIRSSSPDLPSVDEMLSQKPKGPAIRSGSNIASIPDDATMSFTSAREIWKSAQASQRNDPSPAPAADNVVVIDEIASSPLASVQPVAKVSKPADPELTTVASPESPNGTQVEQPWKKYKPKTPEKDTSQNNTHWKTPSPATPVHALPDLLRQSATGTPSKLTPEGSASDYVPGQPLMLETAVARRKDWTPPQIKVQLIRNSYSSDGEGEPVTREDAEMATNSFGSMVSAYRCDGTPAPEQDSDSQAQKKRKVAEPRGGVASVAKPPKPKAPRKKPRTMTELATSAYKRVSQAEADDLNVPKDPPSPAEESAAAAVKPKPKPRKRQSKAKKPPPPKPILFSPETALRQVARQDFVFGTSSQLATEQSPTLLRDLQAAMKSSNQIDCYELATPLNSDGIEPPDMRAKLWAAAARNEDGDLFDVQVVDIAEGSLPPPRLANGDDPFGYVRAAAEDTVTARDGADGNGSDSFVDISDVIHASQAHEPPEQVEGSLDAENGKQPKSPAGVTGLPQEAVAPPMPAFASYSDAQLLREVTGFGFKPIKRRAAMISVLEQCWQQKNSVSYQQVRMSSTAAGRSTQATTGDSSTATAKGRKRPHLNTSEAKPEPSGPVGPPPPSAQMPETPKRQRGRPKKNAEPSPASPAPTGKRGDAGKAKSSTVIEIPDSDFEADELRSSPCSSAEQTFSPSQPVELTTSMGEDTELSLTMTPDDEDEATLFAKIAKAVKTGPRTTDSTNPSWHEKILLYDPIVIEDFAAWLNSGELTRVGHDGEVSPGVVKKWCESKSICCLWKVNLRGQERKRF